MAFVFGSIWDRYNRNGLNALSKSVDQQGKSIINLVGSHQLSPEQFAELLSAVNMNIKNGELSIHHIDKNKGLIDQSFLTIELLQQIAGNAPVHAMPADDSITLDKLALTKESSNKYNPDESVNGALNRANGVVTTNPDFITTGFIRVTDVSSYIFRVVRSVVYYDGSKDFYSADLATNARLNAVVIPPSNAVYMRASWGVGDFTGRQQINEGDVILPFEEYYKYINNKYVERQNIVNNDITDKAISYNKTNFMELGKNRFNKNTVTDGYYVDPARGILMPNVSYVASDYIDISDRDTFSMNGPVRFLAFYQSNGTYVSGLSNVAASTTLTKPTKADLVIVSFVKEQKETFQLEAGSTSTNYEPYGYKIPQLITESNSGTLNVENDVFGKWNLKNFQAQAGKYTNPSFNERVEIAILGDSWVRSKHRITEPLRNKLKNIYGNGGIGFVGFAEIRLAPAETQIATTGTWNLVSKEKGLDMRQYESKTVGSKITLTTFENSDELEIHHIQQTGSYRYRVNGGTWKTVNTATGTFISDSSFTRSYITLEIEVLSGTVTLLNAYLYNNKRGAVVHQWGFGGATAGDFTSVNRSHFISEFKKTNVRSVGILLGTNDMAQNVGLDNFKDNISDIVSRIKAADPLVDIFLVAPSGNNLSRSYTMKEYDEALFEVANDNDLAYVSLYKNMGTYAEQNERGLFEDDVHPNTDGGYQIANIVYDRLLRI